MPRMRALRTWVRGSFSLSVPQHPCSRKSLDATHLSSFPSQPKSHGQALLNSVWKRLNLVEYDYFGLEFQNVPSHWVRALGSCELRLSTCKGPGVRRLWVDTQPCPGPSTEAELCCGVWTTVWPAHTALSQSKRAKSLAAQDRPTPGREELSSSRHDNAYLQGACAEGLRPSL